MREQIGDEPFGAENISEEKNKCAQKQTQKRRRKRQTAKNIKNVTACMKGERKEKEFYSAKVVFSSGIIARNMILFCFVFHRIDRRGCPSRSAIKE